MSMNKSVIAGELSPIGSITGSITRQDIERHGTYSGPVVFDPSDEEQIISAANLIVPEDIAIHAIPAYRPDVRDTTAGAADVAAGKVFYGADGSPLIGSQPVIRPSYTLLATQEFEHSTTSTAAASIRSIGNLYGVWTSDYLIYVKVRDTAGRRAGYWLGSDTFFLNVYPAGGATNTQVTNRAIFTYAVNSNGKTIVNGVTGGSSAPSGGIYAHIFSLADRSSGRCSVGIYSKYSSSYGTIDSTYVVEIYALDWPDGISPFNA